MVQECLDGRAGAGLAADGRPRPAAVAVLRRGRGEAESLFAGLGELWVRGMDMDWGRVFADSGAKRVGLPTYAFQRERYWLRSSGAW
jgi:acyl transferase domain-containing protein